MSSDLARRFRALLPACDFASLRVVDERTEALSVRRGVLEPVRDERDTGAMVTVHAGGGIGYAATADLSDTGLATAIERAHRWATGLGPRFAFDPRAWTPAEPDGDWESGPAVDAPLAERIALLLDVARGLGGHPDVVDWGAQLLRVDSETTYVTPRGEARQRTRVMAPELRVVAARDGVVQQRTTGQSAAVQGGLEVLAALVDTSPRLVEEVLALVAAPVCPSGPMDLVLDSDQMMLQIHESIGHPLELDRILGDERNYAGTSFVTPDMFGTFRYGSELLNITFDPAIPGELASYAWDDTGSRADKVWIIRDGVLVAPLGSALSQARLPGLGGTANARACSWNRPPIDRMANLNLEPGVTPFDALIAGIERGVYMRTNRAWSIDDQRDKFQFGCEWGQLIEDGRLTTPVRNPNYRGRSTAFWRSLAAVGDAGTWRVHGTPYCGKGEPNQAIRVGHATPACRFANVDVFGVA